PAHSSAHSPRALGRHEPVPHLDRSQSLRMSRTEHPPASTAASPPATTATTTPQPATPPTGTISDAQRLPDPAWGPPTVPSGSPSAVVSARSLTRSFGDTEVIRPLDLDIEPGTIVGLIGPSGCGKTTTVRLLTGLLAPTSGSATVFGRDATDLSA